MADPREEKRPPEPAKKQEVSTGHMHENVPDWSDPTCACEAEPYWQAVGEEEEAKKRQDENPEPC